MEWLHDLQEQRAVLQQKIKSGALCESTANNDYELLEKLSLSGNEAKLVEGLIMRRKQVDTDLDLYRYDTGLNITFQIKILVYYALSWSSPPCFV